MNDRIISAIIIDDEELAREIIKNYLEAFPYIKIVNESSNGFEGAKAIQEHTPDLVFLDIQMPKLNGFEMLEIIDEDPVIIFTTAYDQYTIKAFEHNAVDYLLKPFSPDRFTASVNRALELTNAKTGNESRKNILPAPANESLNRIVVKSSGKIHIIPVSDIEVIESQDDYVMIYTHKEKYLKQQTMKYYDKFLDGELFVRIHRSYIVNLNAIEKIEPFEKESYIVITKNKIKIRASKSGYKRLREKLDF